MKKRNANKTAEVNLKMLADLKIEEAVRFERILKIPQGFMGIRSHFPHIRRLPLCLSLIAELLYKRTNQLTEQANNPVILEWMCGYSPRVLLFKDRYRYIGTDTPEVTDELKSHGDELFAEGEAGNYFSVDLTLCEVPKSLMEEITGSVTVITQGDLTQLTTDQKENLMNNIHTILKEKGGCWIIPDGTPDKLLPQTIESVVGKRGNKVYQQIIRLWNEKSQHSESKNGWQSTNEIIAGLLSKGYCVQPVLLYADDLNMVSLKKLSTVKANRLTARWNEMFALVVTADPQIRIIQK